MKKASSSEFSEQEARKRFEAALRGARITGHKPMSEMKVAKRTKQQPNYKAGLSDGITEMPEPLKTVAKNNSAALGLVTKKGGGSSSRGRAAG